MIKTELQRIVCETCHIVSIQVFSSIEEGRKALGKHKNVCDGIHLAAIVDALVEAGNLGEEHLSRILDGVESGVNPEEYHFANIRLT